MKRLFLFFCLILCFSCEQEPLIGDCPPIELSKEELLFDAQEGTDSAIVENMFWWFEGLEKDCTFIRPAYEPNYCDNNYCNSNKNEIVKAEGIWFTATKINENTILVSVKRNETGQQRRQYVSITGTHEIGNKIGRCFAKVSITQSAD